MAEETTGVAEGTEQNQGQKGPTLEELQKANASKDRVIAELQEGKTFPKWAQDAGYKTREEFLAAARKPAAQADNGGGAASGDGDDPEPQFEPEKFLDDDGRMSREGYAAQAKWVREHGVWTARQERKAADYAAALAGESAFLQEAAESAPELLVAKEGDERAADVDALAGMLDGAVNRMLKGSDAPATRQQVLDARAKVAEFVTRICDREQARRAAAAGAEADKEPPAGSPGAGDGQAKRTQGELPPTASMRDRNEAARRASEAEFLAGR